MSAAEADGRPRVLHVAPEAPGGMTAVRRDLLAALADRYRFEVVATHRGSGAARRLAVYSLGLLRVAWWCLRRRGRIVHVHSTVRGSMYRKALVVPLAKALRRRVVLHVHSGPGDVASFRRKVGRAGAAVLHFCLGRADVVLSVSAASAAQLRDAFDLPNIELLPNPAPPVSPSPAAARDDLFAIFLGGFENPVKGGAEILAVLERLEPGALRMVLAGPGELPEEGRRLLESRPEVEWRGWIEGEERERVMEAATIFVLSSSSEGLPIALLEAMSLGMAIVATEVGGVPDVVTDGTEALLAPPEDLEALAAALRRLLADGELRARLGNGAQARAAGMGIERFAERIDAIYRRLLDRLST
jgi:glycosyltransferase involved in cell wall biosynthesis